MSESTQTYDSPTLRRASGLVAVLAALLFWAPTVFTGYGWILVVGPLLGSAIVLLVAVNLYRVEAGSPPLLSVSVLVTLLAVVGAAAPFLLGVTSDLVVWTMAVAGVLAALLSAYTAVGSWRLRTESATAS